jgi:hypothetical protein
LTRRVSGITGIALALLSCACFSPAGMYREWRSDKHEPSASDLAGTWRVTPQSAVRAAATGLPLADLQAGFITFRADGTCRGDLYSGPCGRFVGARRTPDEACHWAVRTDDGPAIWLTFGQGDQTMSFQVHRLESEPPILWQYICDPDNAEYLEFQRSGK